MRCCGRSADEKGAHGVGERRWRALMSPSATGRHMALTGQRAAAHAALAVRLFQSRNGKRPMHAIRSICRFLTVFCMSSAALLAPLPVAAAPTVLSPGAIAIFNVDATGLMPYGAVSFFVQAVDTDVPPDLMSIGGAR